MEQEQNRVLTLEEVLSLEEGHKVWVEHNNGRLSANFDDQEHTVTRDNGGYVLALVDKRRQYWGIPDDDWDIYFGFKYRVWLREPTPDELAANPWSTEKEDA